MRTAALALFAIALSATCLAAGRDVTTPVLGPSPVSTGAPVVATNGETFFSVWGSQGAIYGAFFDRNGNRITSSDIQIIRVSSDLYSSYQLATIGERYVLFWTDSTGSHLTRIGDDGRAQQTIAITDIPRLYITSVASNGKQILVVGGTGIFFPPSTIVGYLINSDGSLVRGPIDVSSFGTVHVTMSGNTFLVASAEPTGVYVQPVPVNPAIPIPSKLQVSTLIGTARSETAAAATSGDEIVVVWSELGPNGETAWSSVIAKDGSGTKHQIVVPSAPNGYQTRIIWNGEAYVASIGKFVVRLDRSGIPTEPPVDAGQLLWEVASIGDVVCAVGLSYPGVNARAMKTVLHRTDGLHDINTESLSITPKAQSNPAVATDGIDFMTVFQEWDTKTRSITAARMSRIGDRLDGEGIPVTVQASPAIAFGASTYMIVWCDATGVHARRYTFSGVPIDTAPLLIRNTTNAYNPAIAWSGSAFFVIWSENRIYGATVTPDGAVSAAKRIDPGFSSPNVPGSAYFDDEPHLAWNGQEFLVIWGLYVAPAFEGPPARVGTAGIRVAADGMPIDASATPIEVYNPMTGSVAYHASVSSNGRDFLLALDGTNLSTLPVSAAGVVGTRQTFFQWFGGIQSDIAFDGVDYVVSWKFSGGTNAWLATARARSDGYRNSTVVTEAQTPDSYSPPAVAVNALRESMTTVSEFPASPVTRVRAYFDWEMQPMPAPPQPPLNVTAVGSPSNFVLRWENSPTTAGVLVQFISTNGFDYNGALVPADKQPLIFSSTYYGYIAVAARLRAFGVGGLSEPVTVPIVTPPRRRAAGR